MPRCLGGSFVRAVQPTRVSRYWMIECTEEANNSELLIIVVVSMPLSSHLLAPSEISENNKRNTLKIKGITIHRVYSIYSY